MSQAEVLPDIEAREFRVTPLRKSTSGAIYLFQGAKGLLPKTGNLVLIQRNKKPIFAFKVIKTDPVQSQFIGKKVRRYDQVGELEFRRSYSTIEKVTDLLAPPLEKAPPPVHTAVDSTPSPEEIPDPVAPPPMTVTAPPEERPQDPPPALPPPEAPAEVLPADRPPDLAPPETSPPEAETTDLTPLDPIPSDSPQTAPPSDRALDIYDYDDELDQTTSPGQEERKINELTDDELEDSDRGLQEIDEVTRLEPRSNMISVSVGMYQNFSNFDFSSPQESNGLSISYSRTFARDFFARSKNTQDSLALEFGFIHYSLVNVFGNNDSTALYPLFANMRYDLHASPTFTFFIYSGMQHNWVQSTSNTTNEEVNELQGPQVNVGLGLLYNIGPQWYLRADLGRDKIAAGLCLKW